MRWLGLFSGLALALVVANAICNKIRVSQTPEAYEHICSRLEHELRQQILTGLTTPGAAATDIMKCWGAPENRGNLGLPEHL